MPLLTKDILAWIIPSGGQHLIQFISGWFWIYFTSDYKHYEKICKNGFNMSQTNSLDITMSWVEIWDFEWLIMAKVLRFISTKYFNSTLPNNWPFYRCVPSVFLFLFIHLVLLLSIDQSELREKGQELDQIIVLMGTVTLYYPSLRSQC